MNESATKRPETPRRKEIRTMLSRGMTPRHIALALGISTQAVYKHVTAIRETDEGAA